MASREKPATGGVPQLRRWRFTVLRDSHERHCRCTYCGSGPFGVRPMRFGLNVPPAWRHWNAWWVIKYAPRRYLRWIWPRAFFGPPNASLKSREAR